MHKKLRKKKKHNKIKKINSCAAETQAEHARIRPNVQGKVEVFLSNPRVSALLINQIEVLTSELRSDWDPAEIRFDDGAIRVGRGRRRGTSRPKEIRDG